MGLAQTVSGRDERIGALCVALAAVLFGCMPLMATVSYHAGSNAYMITLGRFFFGALFAGIVLLHKKARFALTRGQFHQILLLSLFYAATPLLLYASYQYIHSGLATTLHFSYPIVVMLLMVVLFGKRFGRRQVGSLLLCMTGLGLVLQLDGYASVSGMTIAVLSGAVYAVYIVLLGKSDLRDISVFALTFWLSLFATLELTALAVLSRNFFVFQTQAAWIAEVGLGLFTTTMALALFQKGVFLCGEVRAAMFSTLEPVTGVLVGMAALHETITARMLAGIVLILLSVLLLLDKRKSSHPSAPSTDAEGRSGRHKNI